MSRIDIIKENIQFQQLLRENSTTAILRDEYLIPDTHPDVQELLSVDAKPIITQKEVTTDKVLLEGVVQYNVLYLSREENMLVSSVSYSEKFTNSLELTESEHRLECEVECKMEHINATIMNERKISIEGVINLSWEIYKGTEFDYVKDIEGTEGVEVLKKSESINRLVANKDIELSGKSMIRVGMDKPQVSEILKCSLSLHKKEVKLAEDKAFLGCYCKINLLYMGAESKDIISLEDDVYLSKDEEIIGVYNDMLASVSYDVDNSEIGIEEDDLGENRIVNIEFLVKGNVKVYSNESIDLIKDAYCTKFPVQLRKDNYEIGLVYAIQSTDVIVKDNLNIAEENAKPEEIINSMANIIVTDKSINDNKIIVEGIVKANIVYKSNDEEKNFHQVLGDIPFVASMDINGVNSEMKAILRTNLESLDCSIEANTIAIKANLSLSVKVFYDIEKEFISDVIEEEGELPEKKASVVIYVVGKGDTLWSIAKKYSSTVEELVSINDIENPDALEINQKLIIPGRATF